VPGLAAIGIVTKDMAKSVRFYRLLGVDVAGPDGDHLDATLPSGVRLMWDSLELIKRLDPEWKEPVGQRMSLAFECASTAEVDRVHQRITGAGFRSKKAPWDAFWGQRYAQVVDPDGNVVDLFAALPTPAA
jgi:catechol 2,3-dioxygenase-like lactoylglutathione lyase family enzyme